MAKKTNNPAEAYRKQIKAKELKRNKEARQKARDTQNVKKDHRELERELSSLKASNDPSNKKRIEELVKEIDYIKKVKEQYVADHPEEHDKVYRIRPKVDKTEDDGEGSKMGHLYDEMGRLRDPKRSVYYDAVYNPFGVPPPGMPYREKTLEEESEEEEDDDIVMPAGPPPAQGSDDSEAESDDSDDIPLPPGPPPPKPISAPPPAFAPTPNMPFRPPRPPFGAPPGQGYARPPQGYGFPPFPPPGAGVGNFRPQGFRPNTPNVPHNIAPRPVQDPLGDKPTVPFQSHHMVPGLPARPPNVGAPGSLSSGPGQPAPTAPTASAPAATGSAEISAAPVLRDLRKEATAFIPRGIKRRKGAPGTTPVGSAGGGVTVNAAPGSAEVDEDGDQIKRKRKEEAGGGLMGKLSGVLGSVGPVSAGSGGGGESSGGGKTDVDEDYQKFLEGLGDIA